MAGTTRRVDGLVIPGDDTPGTVLEFGTSNVSVCLLGGCILVTGVGVGIGCVVRVSGFTAVGGGNEVSLVLGL